MGVKMVGVMQYQISHAASIHSSWPQSASHFTTGFQMSSLMYRVLLGLPFTNKTLSGFYDYSKLYMKQATTAIAGQAVV